MKKENGRLKPAEKEERSSKTGKSFRCPLCGAVTNIKNSVFGGQYICTECDLGIMEEVN